MTSSSRRHDAKVLIDSLSLVYMAGSEIDFVDDLLGQSFQITQSRTRLQAAAAAPASRLKLACLSTSNRPKYPFRLAYRLVRTWDGTIKDQARSRKRNNSMKIVDLEHQRRQGAHRQRSRQWLKDSDPDIVCLQEIKI